MYGEVAWSECRGRRASPVCRLQHPACSRAARKEGVHEEGGVRADDGGEMGQHVVLCHAFFVVIAERKRTEK